MAFAAYADFSTALRNLRRSQGLTLDDVSRQTGFSKAALSAWENGTRHPRGPALGRLLDVLARDPRTKARLLHLADPQQARLVLANSHLGAQVDVGMVLRVMRERRGIVQADLAARIGVTQATVSRWEVGDLTPSTEAIHALAFALGASVEEALALASVSGGGQKDFPKDPDDFVEFEWERTVPRQLQEVTLLGWEAELWRRSTKDPRWEPCLVSVLAGRASLLVGEERYGEIVPLVERTVRLAEVAKAHRQAVPAVGALAHADIHLGKGPKAAAENTEAWAARLTDSAAKAWMLRQQGMSLVGMGRTSEGVDWVTRSSEMELRSKPDRPDPWSHHAEMLAEAHLASGDARRAAAVVGGRRERRFPSYLYIQIEHALGRAVTGAEMAFLRFYTDIHDGSPLARRRLEEIERRQAWLKGELPETAEPGHEDPEADRRLWSAVLRENPG